MRVNKYIQTTYNTVQVEKFGDIIWYRHGLIQTTIDDLTHNRWTDPPFRQAVLRARIRFYESFTLQHKEQKSWSR